MRIKGREYLLCVLILFVVLATYAFAFYNLNMRFALLVGVFSSILGSFMIPFGFWGLISRLALQSDMSNRQMRTASSFPSSETTRP